MTEGWAEEEYFSLFDNDESKELTSEYEIENMLPGFILIGLVGWDDFLLLKEGRLFRCPTVPAGLEYVEEFDQANMPAELQPDPKIKQKIKWYLKPVIFGGNPDDENNIEWVDYSEHKKLVKWWNRKYKEIMA